MTRDRDVVVLSLDTPTENDRLVASLAEFMGARVSPVPLRDVLPTSSCLIVSAETLSSAMESVGHLEHLLETSDNVVVHGFVGSDSHDTLLRSLSANTLLHTRPVRQASPFTVCAVDRALSGPLSGLSLGQTGRAGDRGFVRGNGSVQPERIIDVDGMPFLARTTRRGACVYFVGSTEFANLNESVGRDSTVLDWFSRLAPIMMVLRGALGERVWRNELPRACFIIDDPLLTKRYGFLDYERLLETMRPRKFFPCVAFIPWNYRRSQKDVAARLAAQYGEPFLCVHGCDHTRGEFATTDRARLEVLAHQALRRMQQQSRSTGVLFDDVMVFPQGLFSSEAIQALKTCGYLAAVNTSVCPSASAAASLRLRDLLDVAVMRFANFPLFGRRYPRDVSESAFDLFLGKPALLVEHHGYFRGGYDALASFVERLNAAEPRLEWTSLGNVCSRAALVRSTSESARAVRFFTSRFSFTNTGGRTLAYVLARPHPWADSVPSVRVNDRDWPSEVIGHEVTLRLTLEPGQTAVVELGSLNGRSSPLPEVANSRHAARVRMRRYLSEFRDNHLDTSPLLHAMVAAARTLRSMHVVNN